MESKDKSSSEKPESKQVAADALENAKRTREKPLKIKGTLDDALRVLVGKPPAEKLDK